MKTGKAREQAPENSDRSRAFSFYRWLLAGILVLAAFLRFWGLTWGLPDATHRFPYHPDETVVALAAGRVNLLAGEWNPHFYNYGSLLVYAVSLITQILNTYFPPEASLHAEVARLVLVGRLLVAVSGVATVYVTFLIGRRLGGWLVGLFAAVLLACTPMHAVHSHFLTVDIPATLFVTLALYHALRWSEKGWSAALYCGLFAGLAASTKYNAGLALLAGLAAVAIARDKPPQVRWRSALLMIAVCALSFLVTTPGVLLATHEFIRDFGYETVHVRTGHGLVFVHTGPGWWYHLRVNLWDGAAVLLAAVFAGLVRWLWTARKHGFRSAVPWPLVAFTVPYFLLISAAAVRFQRYDIPLLPAMAIAGGYFLAWFSGRYRVLSVAVVLFLLATCVPRIETMARPGGTVLPQGTAFHGDPRYAVGEWFGENVPEGATVGVSRTPWFFSPPLHPANGGPQSASLFEENANLSRWRLIPLNSDADAYAEWPDYVVVSNYEYGDPLRLSAGIVPAQPGDIVKYLETRPDAPEEAKRLTRFWNNVVERYQVIGLWKPRSGGSGPLPPHDAFYPYPTLIVFQRR